MKQKLQIVSSNMYTSSLLNKVNYSEVQLQVYSLTIVPHVECIAWKGTLLLTLIHVFILCCSVTCLIWPILPLPYHNYLHVQSFQFVCLLQLFNSCAFWYLVALTIIV